MAKTEDLLIVNNFHPETIAILDSLYHTHHLWRHSRQDRAELIGSLAGRCRAAATGSWACDKIVYALEGLDLIAAWGVGVDGIDFDKTRAGGIRVTNTPGVLDDAVADIAIALILSTMRNVVAGDRFIRAGKWQSGQLALGKSLAGKTLGIAGLGRIGEAVVHRALPLKLQIAYHNRAPKSLPYSYYPSLAELAAASDILLSVLPGGEATHHMIDAPILKALGPEGVFINVGRGSAVDEAALVQALANGTIAAAGLDVFEHEPNVPDALLGLDNVVLLPHIGSATPDTRREMGNLVIRNLAAYFNGEPLLCEVP